MAGGTMRIGADVGGTFTDVVLETGSGMFSTKVLTTYDAPERGILDGVRSVVAEAGADLADLEAFIHGTTLATNALIGRTGARTALVTTAGFRDTIEMRTESRFEQYDLNLVLPAPLIERRDRHVLAERIGVDGRVLRPFDEAEARALVEHLADRPDDEAYEAVAIGFIHAYVDGTHERLFRDLLLERLPDVAVSISSEVSPQMREFERFNTVCANAYVQPLMASYLRELDGQLQALGARCPVYLIHSGGGLMSVDSAVRFPVRLIESGPAGGAIFAADIAARHGLDSVLSYDMGGTTAKICLIEDHAPSTAKTFEVARTHRFTKGSGMPISIPVIEMIEIGAGGGSIAGVDVLGQIRVGPLSAGSEPGPASYGLGGIRPTVTDANLVLGRLSADTFGAPGIDLSDDAARGALDSDVADLLGLDTDEAAAGVVEVVDENMANAARVHAVENGKDVARYTMIAFGGGAPLHAGRLCDKLAVDELLVPPGASVGSAIGFLRAPFAYEALRSHHAMTAEFDHRSANRMLAELAEEATNFVTGALAASDDAGDPPVLETERWAFMRYAGQGWEIPVRLDAAPFDHLGGEFLANRFEKAYEEFFGRAIAGLAIEAIGWSVRVATRQRPVERVTRIEAAREVAVERTRAIHDAGTDAVVEAAVVERDALSPGDRVTGPAVIVESQTTTWVSSSRQAVLQADGCLLLTRREGAR
ncbi:MAG: hydantoinase/oxoprolinase family protein [Acidimicrobiales bacterium]|jgi:N-methylhydantoinase A|nr:hydantoinase/oxoprolinase family protein [Acidimicrobiales bacterium]